MYYPYVLLILLSILLTMAGGWNDLQSSNQPLQKKFTILGYSPSKEHLWHDSLYILVLAIALKVVFNL